MTCISVFYSVESKAEAAAAAPALDWYLEPATPFAPILARRLRQRSEPTSSDPVFDPPFKIPIA